MDYNELEPKIVFQYFKEISNIPHGSGNTEEISKYLMNFAKEHKRDTFLENVGRFLLGFLWLRHAFWFSKPCPKK